MSFVTTCITDLISSLLECYDVNYNDLSVPDLGPYMLKSTSANETFTFNDGITYLTVDESQFGNDTITSNVYEKNENSYDVINITQHSLLN